VFVPGEFGQHTPEAEEGGVDAFKEHPELKGDGIKAKKFAVWAKKRIEKLKQEIQEIEEKLSTDNKNELLLKFKAKLEAKLEAKLKQVLRIRPSPKPSYQPTSTPRFTPRPY